MKKYILMSILAFTLLFSPITTLAAETKDSNAEIATHEAETINQLIKDYGVKIYSYAPYTSKTFKPKTDRIDILFGSWGVSGTYSYYLEERNANGTWTVVNSHTLKYGGSISTSAYVTPDNTYRVRATTTDKYPNGIFIEVLETIYD